MRRTQIYLDLEQGERLAAPGLQSGAEYVDSVRPDYGLELPY